MAQIAAILSLLANASQNSSNASPSFGDDFAQVLAGLAPKPQLQRDSAPAHPLQPAVHPVAHAKPVAIKSKPQVNPAAEPARAEAKADPKIKSAQAKADPASEPGTEPAADANDTAEAVTPVGPPRAIEEDISKAAPALETLNAPAGTDPDAVEEAHGSRPATHIPSTDIAKPAAPQIVLPAEAEPVTSDAPPADILKIAAKAGAPERGPVTVAVKDTAPAPLPAVTDKTARAVSDIAASLAQAQTGKSEGDDTGDPSQQQDQTPERHDAPQADIALSAPKSAPAPQQQVSIPTEPVQAAPAPAAASVQASAAASAAPQPQAQAEVPLANLGAAIAARAMGGAKTFEIRLDPAELGRVDVQLNVGHDGKADATITVHRPETLALLLRDSQNLERTLRDSGLDVSNSSLNFSLKGEGRQGDGGGASGALRRNLPDSVLARSEAANASIASLNIGSPNGRLDIRV